MDVSNEILGRVFSVLETILISGHADGQICLGLYKELLIKKSREESIPMAIASVSSIPECNLRRDPVNRDVVVFVKAFAEHNKILTVKLIKYLTGYDVKKSKKIVDDILAGEYEWMMKLSEGEF